jgi:hypothetical protein
MEFAEFDESKQRYCVDSRFIDQFELSRLGSDHPERDLQSLVRRVFDGHSAVR